MKNLKKVAALVIVLAMALSSVAFAAYTDVAEDAGYSEAVEVMSALGLLKGYEDGTFGPDKTITRAEFAAVIVRALGMEDAAAGAVANTIFSDVTSAHWGAGYVQIANQQGIIAGYGDGTFGPDDEVTYEQAVKMIVCALGYGIKFAGVENAYPSAYLSQANTSGITVGATGKIGEKATRAVVAKLVYNALDVKLMEQTGFGTDTKFEEVDKTLLSSKLNVAKIDASIVSLNFDPEEADKVNIEISDMDSIYAVAMEYEDKDDKFDKTNALQSYYYAEGANLQLGYSSVAYVDISEDESEWTILAMTPKAGKNNTLVLSGVQTEKGAITLPDGTKEGKAEYYKNGYENDNDSVAIKLDKDAKLFKNANVQAEGSLTTFGTNWTKGDYKEITLIDNNNDKKYDVIYVSDYYSFLVDEIKERTFKISGKAGVGSKDSVTLDPEDEKKIFSITDINGNDVAFADIKIGDVLNVFASVDTNTSCEYYDVIVTSNTVEGTISEVAGSTAKPLYVIGDNSYEGLKKLGLTSSKSGIFTLDMYNTIIDFKVDGSNMKFGLIYKIYNTADVVEDAPKAILYTAEGSFVTYDFAKNVTIETDAVSGRKTNAEVLALVKSGKELNVETGLVLYVVNANNEITQFYADNAGIKVGMNTYKNDTLSGEAYRPSTARLGSLYVTESSILIANELANYTGLAKENLSLTSGAIFNEDDTYDVEYIANDQKEILVAVVFGATPKVAKETLPMIITGVATSTDDEGATAKTLRGYVDGDYVTVKVTEDTYVYGMDDKEISTWTGLEKGALIQVAGEGEAAAIRVILTADDVMTKYASIKGYNTTDEDNDKEGFLYAGQLADIDGVDVVFTDSKVGNKGTVVYEGEAAYVNLKTDKIVADGSYDIDDVAETDADKIDSNDDYVIVYKFDGECLAAYVIDVDGDSL